MDDANLITIESLLHWFIGYTSHDYCSQRCRIDYNRGLRRKSMGYVILIWCRVCFTLERNPTRERYTTFLDNRCVCCRTVQHS
jgi:hypothetical protein